MDKVINIFNRYYLWCLCFSIVFLSLGSLSLFLGLRSQDVRGIFNSIITNLIPAILLFIYCIYVRKSRKENTIKNLENACRYQSLFIVYLGVITLFIIAFIIFGVVASLLPLILL